MSLILDSKPVITVENLSKAFGGKKAVDSLSFSVPKGSLFAFLGQNGAGKTTTINMLVGLLEKDSGAVLYNGKENVISFKNKIGVVFQNNIFDELLTVEENLLVYGALYMPDRKAVKKRCNEIISLLHIDDFYKKRIKTLSGGQKRKVEIARALFTSPEILFLDEPTTGLDPKTRAEVWDILHSIRKATGMTLFLTTHYMEETANADYVVIIHQGKKVCAASPAELKSRYSFDRLVITPKEARSFEKRAQEKGVKLKKTADTYTITCDSTDEIIELINFFKSDIRFFEVLKGSMDDVFLNATGEHIGEGL
ncbi:MAG TPA: ABC transporter ATP-binding protein [Oscillospiraceae bacterium]|nr:ABC transporter ATP-binding protein [Oscillospiraceae bacterium]